MTGIPLPAGEFTAVGRATSMARRRKQSIRLERQTGENSLMAGLPSPSAFELPSANEVDKEMGRGMEGWQVMVIKVVVGIMALACPSFLYGYPPHVTHAVY